MKCNYQTRVFVDKYKKYMDLPCGKCFECLHNRRQEWTTRLIAEHQTSSSSCFLTLTYTDQNIPYGDDRPTLCKRDLQLFLKRLRRDLEYNWCIISENGESVLKRLKRRSNYKMLKIRYFAVGEYGSRTSRPHYHMILFNYPFNIRLKSDNILFTKLVRRAWKNGNIHIGTTTEKSIGYTAGYLFGKGDDVEGRQDHFMLCSRRGGIGFKYLEDNFDKLSEKVSTEIMIKGNKRVMPKYYINKLYNDYDKEAIGQSKRWYAEEAERKALEYCEKEKIEPITYFQQVRASALERARKNKKTKSLL